LGTVYFRRAQTPQRPRAKPKALAQGPIRPERPAQSAKTSAKKHLSPLNPISQSITEKADGVFYFYIKLIKY